MNDWWFVVALTLGYIVGYCACACVVARRMVAVEKLARDLRTRIDELEGE